MSAAIVGVGLAGASHHAALRALGVPVAGVLAARPERTQAAATTSSVRAYGSLDELLADERVQRVHVCVPTAAHRLVATAVAAAGKAVLCEKPLTLDGAEARALADGVAAAGVAAHLGFNRRFDRGVQTLRALVAAGELGEPVNVWGSYQQAFNAAPSSFDWRFDPAQIGDSRVVSEIGSHWFDLAEHVLGRPLRGVHAMLTFAGVRELAAGGTATPSSEDAFAALVEYDGGVTGSVFATELAHGSWDDVWLRVDGSRRSGWWHSRRPNEATVAHKREGVRTVGDGADSASFPAMLAEIYGVAARSAPPSRRASATARRSTRCSPARGRESGGRSHDAARG